MNRTRGFVFVLAALVPGTGAGASSIISLSPQNGGRVMATNELAGAPGVRVGYWNNFNALNLTLGDDESVYYEDGTAVGGGFQSQLTISIPATGNFSDRSVSPVTNDLKMVSGVIDTYTANTLTLSNIPFAQYDIYVYMFDDGATRSGGFTIGGTTYYARGGAGNPATDGSGYLLSTDTTITPGDDSSVDQGNYVRFANLTGAGQVLSLFAADGSTTVERNKTGGIQIVAVPEPGTAGIFALGALLGLRHARRRRG